MPPRTRRARASGGEEVEGGCAASPATPSPSFPLLALPSDLIRTRILPHALSASADALLVCKPLAALGREVLAEQEVRAQLVACRLRRLAAGSQAKAKTRVLYHDDDRALALRRALLPEQQTPEERTDALLALHTRLSGGEEGVETVGGGEDLGGDALGEEEEHQEAIGGLVEAAGAAGDGVAVRGLLSRRPGCLDVGRLGDLASKAIGGQHEAVAEVALEVWLDAVGPAGGPESRMDFLDFLIDAAGGGLVGVVRLLLARGGPEVTEQRIKDAALWAAARGRGEAGWRPGPTSAIPVASPTTTRAGRVATARALLQAGASPLRALAGDGVEAAIGVLVEAGLDITSSPVGEEALVAAAAADRAYTIHVLLRAGAGARPGAAAAALERAVECKSFKAVAALAGPAGRPEVAAQLLEAAVAAGRVEGARALAAAAGLSREQAEQAEQRAQAVWRARLRALAAESWGQSVAAAVQPVAGRPRYSASA